MLANGFLKKREINYFVNFRQDLWRVKMVEELWWTNGGGSVVD